jgi:ubiquinone/menaquinone biosynthesis C-methylase UbiE
MSLYKDISILVVTPAYGGQLFAGYLTSLLKFERLCKDKGILVDYEFCYNESLIPRARNISKEVEYYVNKHKSFSNIL